MGHDLTVCCDGISYDGSKVLGVLTLLNPFRQTHPIFLDKIQGCENQELPDLGDLEVLKLFLDARGNAFQGVMPLAMRNIAIA